MGKGLYLLGGVALGFAILLATDPERAWWHASAFWFMITAIPGFQHLCFDHNPVHQWLFLKAEQAYLNGPAAPAPPLINIPANEYTWEELGRRTNGFMLPCVIRGLFADSPARDIWGDPQYWIDTFPDAPVRVVVPFRAYKYGELCVNDTQYQDGDMPLPPWHDFSRIKEAVETKEGCRSTGWTPIGPNASVVADALPRERLGAVPYATDPLMFYTAPRADSEAGFFSTDWHIACTGNLAVHIIGSKTWRLMDPRYSHLMRPTTWQMGLGGRGYPDEEVLKKGPMIEYTMNPGDVLFLPPWWWHTVAHAGEPKYTVLATLRTFGHKEALVAHPYLTFHSYFGFAYNAFATIFNIDRGYSSMMKIDNMAQTDTANTKTS